MATFLILKHFGCDFWLRLQSDKWLCYFSQNCSWCAFYRVSMTGVTMFTATQLRCKLKFFSDVRQIRMQFLGCAQLGTVFIFSPGIK